MPDPAQPLRPARPSRAARAEQRRAEIVAAARELFSHKGYRGTGLAEVAERVGLTLPGLLYHFPSKEILLQSVIAERDVESEELAHRLLEMGGEEAIRALIESARRNQRQPEIMRLFLVLVAENLEPSAPVHEHFKTRYRQLRAIFAAGLREGLEAGQIKPGLDPEMAAIQVIAMLDGLAIQWLLDPDEVDLAGVVEHFVLGVIEAHSVFPSEE